MRVVYPMKEKEPLVSIIIVSWNGKKWLDTCLSSIFAQTYKSFEVIVVDNGSTDDTIPWLQDTYPQVVIVKLDHNYGFADGNNKGYEKSRGEFVYFLNNDTELSTHAIKELVKVLSSDARTAGVQSKLLLMEKKNTLDTIGAFLTPTGFLYHNAFAHPNNPSYDKEIPLYTLKGASMMFKRDALDSVSMQGYLFDPDYFAYFEETDVCHRLWIRGYTLKYAPQAVVWHHMGATSSSMETSFVQFHSFKNRVMTYLKNMEWRTLTWLMPFHFLVSEFFAFTMLLRGNVSVWWCIQKAWWWNVSHWSEIGKKRNNIQSTRTVADSRLLPIILKHPPFTYYIQWFLGKPYLKTIS